MTVRKKLIITIMVMASMWLPLNPLAHADSMGQSVSFFTNPNYDYTKRNQLTATLYTTSADAYYYIEDSYWSNLGVSEKTNFTNNLNQIAQEFDNNIYPKEAAFWGSTGSLGAGNDPRITILLEHLTLGTGGYFDSTNEYPVRVAPTSNYRQMIIINVDSLTDSPRRVESLIAHEFQHLISFNQKELLRSVDEDTWLNELRSEYSIDFVGYDQPFQDSTLQHRVGEFLQNPSDSLTEWLNQPFEYGAISLFGKYLVEQYGTGILKDTLQNSKVGITSINDYLQSHHYQQSFEDLFRNWVVTLYLNNPSLDSHYGYHDQNLSNIHISPPETNLFYPFTYTLSYSLKPWQPAWYKFNLDPSIPKSKIVKIEFKPATDFGLVYIDKFGVKQALTTPIYVSNTASLSSFVLVPYNRTKIANFTDNDPAENIVLNISFVDSAPVNLAPAITPVLLVDGNLIRESGEKDVYVIAGKHKRHMISSAISKYANLVTQKISDVDAKTFDSYQTSNYIRIPRSQQVYAIWFDNTKHLLKIPLKNFARLGRDPNSVFTVSSSEFLLYKTGKPVLK